MQWPDKKADAPIKPYNRNRCKLTITNSRISVKEQVRRYIEWAQRQGLKDLHVFPENNRSKDSFACHAVIRNSPYRNNTYVVDPADWGFK